MKIHNVANYLFGIILGLSVAQSVSADISRKECYSGIMDIPENHWLLKEKANAQKTIIFFLSQHNSYVCERERYKEVLMTAIEADSTTGLEAETRAMIKSFQAMFHLSSGKEQLYALVEKEKVDQLFEHYSEPFSSANTLRSMGLL